ncbi:MAG: cytochrome c biogenesis protein CcsA [Flavobacteriaceae bacterium]|nr:cytochrome c biogenesis protein CcsA [Flavobacteriaceae bacterium]
MAILFVLFAVAMALGTFIEHWYSTDTARIYIYNTRWFEWIMLFFMINFIGNIKKYNLFQKSKWTVLMLHLSWVLIIVGAFVTRYISYEGMMSIREGASENVFMSDRTFLTVRMDGMKDGEKVRKVLQEPILVTAEGKRSSLPWKSDFNQTPVKVAYKGFVSHAEETLVEDPSGKKYIKLVESSGGNRHDHFVEEGEVASVHNVLFSFNKQTEGAINIRIEDSIQTIQMPWDGTFMRMADRLEGIVKADSVQPLMLRSLYRVGSMQFVLPNTPMHGVYKVQQISKSDQTENDQDALLLDITVQDQTQSVAILGSKGRLNAPTKLSLGGLDFNINYGSLGYTLPFSVKLNDFIAEKYPGTESSYKSFTSKVTVQDEPSFDYDIYMNHVLDHKGYRFFQSSFDTRDEKGTVLSVSHDFWGKWITYVGYFLLYFGMLASLFVGNTRFMDLKRQLERVRKQKTKILMGILLLTVLSVQGQSTAHTEHQRPTKEQIDSVFQTLKVDAAHAKKFGALVIQDAGGRMKPINTFSSELLRKTTRKNKYKGLNSDQVFLAMMLHPSLWYNMEMIHLDWKNDSIRRVLEIPDGQNMGKALDFFDAQGNYKLQPYLKDAYATNTPNSFQKDFIKSDQKLGLLNQALGGTLLRIFPLLNDDNNKWVSPVDFNSGKFEQDSLYGNFIKNAIPYYLMNLRSAQKTGDYTGADKMLQALKDNQKKYGQTVMPSDRKIQAEITYNKIDVFNKLFRYYALLGGLLFLLLILQIFKDRKIYRGIIKVFKYLIYLMFVAHILGLAMRWYISGHAPWSDAYESILYVAWATMAVGIYYGRKSDLTLAATTFVSCMLLFIANQNWVDPEIGNLVPVLDSYWLMIHVAVIVGSYGPFTLGMILGVVNMVLILLANKANKETIGLHIKELTIINEMVLTIGLIMLTIGNFLGGMWANESWGRYWGWDPKETWALISIMVYAFVIHMRLIPALKGKWLFNFVSVIAFASIMMTYFGVNFYLSGLHSYASGDQVITPTFVWYTVASVFVLGILSWLKNRKLNF